MILTVTTEGGDIFPVDVPAEMELENFLALCQAEAPTLQSVGMDQLQVVSNGRAHTDLKRPLTELGLKDNDTVMVMAKRTRPRPQPQAPSGLLPQIDFSQIRIPGSSGGAGAAARRTASQEPAGGAAGGGVGNLQQIMDDPARVRAQLQQNPGALAILRERNPPLAEALESGDEERFAKVLREQAERQRDLHMRRIRAMNDPFDLEGQQFIEQQIHQENIESILEAAIEHTPESFGVVTMLYISCKVNGHKIKAFVDSGAQTTIMSAGCAQRCNIIRLVDRRFTGIAKGVGTQKIIGRIHMAQLQIEETFLPTSFTVLEDQSMDMLLGLDMLKRHQCVIDLRRGVLQIGTTNTETSFLHENELPEDARLNGAEDGKPSASEEQQVQEAIKRSTDSTQAAGGSSSHLSEASITKLVDMGFTRESAVSALDKASGDVNAALTSLLANSLATAKPPS